MITIRSGLSKVVIFGERVSELPASSVVVMVVITAVIVVSVSVTHEAVIRAVISPPIWGHHLIVSSISEVTFRALHKRRHASIAEFHVFSPHRQRTRSRASQVGAKVMVRTWWEALSPSGLRFTPSLFVLSEFRDSVAFGSVGCLFLHAFEYRYEIHGLISREQTAQLFPYTRFDFLSVPCYFDWFPVIQRVEQMERFSE